MIRPDDIDRFRVNPGDTLDLSRVNPRWRGEGRAARAPKAEAKAAAKETLRAYKQQLAEAQELFYASDTYSMLVIFQALDAAGKDGAIKHVMSGVNPQGCQVFSFKQPSAEELDHSFLWRCVKALPERGRIGIFNRSYYEEVLVVRVHPELLQYQRLPSLNGLEPGKDPGIAFWRKRYEDINALEQHLARNGTVVVKFFLHISKEEQRRRFLDRLNEPGKHWKFSLGDLPERERWDDYQRAYEEAISATSTEWAPWYVIPADHKWVARLLVGATLTRTITGLHLELPSVSGEERTELEAARRQLEAEGPA